MAKEPAKPKRYRLKERAQIDGAVREPGYEFTLADGVKGPHRPVRKGPDLIDYDPANGLDANRISGISHDEPLYEEVTDA